MGNRAWVSVVDEVAFEGAPKWTAHWFEDLTWACCISNDLLAIAQLLEGELAAPVTAGFTLGNGPERIRYEIPDLWCERLPPRKKLVLRGGASERQRMDHYLLRGYRYRGFVLLRNDKNSVDRALSTAAHGGRKDVRLGEARAREWAFETLWRLQGVCSLSLC